MRRLREASASLAAGEGRRAAGGALRPARAPDLGGGACKGKGAGAEAARRRRLGSAALLDLEDDVQGVGTCADGASAWTEAQRLGPDVIVSDIEMPGMTGLELAMRVQEHALPCKLVIVTTFARPGYLRRALDAGVAGYLLKDAPAHQLADAVRKVHGGGRG